MILIQQVGQADATVTEHIRRYQAEAEAGEGGVVRRNFCVHMQVLKASLMVGRL